MQIKVTLFSFAGLVLMGCTSMPAQQLDAKPPAGVSAPAPVVQPSPPGTDTPSADMLKKAKLAGYNTKTRKGVTYFCKDEVELGSHFSRETCVDENRLSMVLEHEQLQREQLANHACGGGGTCGAK